jgi:hypothetical protein
MLWSTVKENFDSRTAKIASHIDKFEAESRIAVNEVTVTGTRAIQAALTQLIITPQIVLPFTDVLYARNDKFVGRDIELEGINNALVKSSTNPSALLSICVHGTGGIGKTQVAVEYTYRYIHEHDYIFWLPAENRLNLEGAYSSLFDKLLLGDVSSDDRTKTQKLQQWFAKSK